MIISSDRVEIGRDEFRHLVSDLWSDAVRAQRLPLETGQTNGEIIDQTACAFWETLTRWDLVAFVVTRGAVP